jgi:hypothetical protein
VVPGIQTYTAASPFVSFHGWLCTLSLSICLCNLWREDLNSHNVQPKFCHILTEKSTKNQCFPHGIVTERAAKLARLIQKIAILQYIVAEKCTTCCVGPSIIQCLCIIQSLIPWNLLSLDNPESEYREPSGTVVSIYRPTWCHIPEDLKLHQQCCKNLKSCKCPILLTSLNL